MFNPADPARQEIDFHHLFLRRLYLFLGPADQQIAAESVEATSVHAPEAVVLRKHAQSRALVAVAVAGAVAVAERAAVAGRAVVVEP